MNVRTRRTVATLAVAALGLTALAACEGEVTKRRCLGDNNTACQILVVDDDGKERWIDADGVTWQQCKIGAQYPACSSGGYDNQEARNRQWDEEKQDRQDKRRRGQGPDVDPAPNPPVRNERQDNRNRQSREVCVQAIMTPSRSVRVDWSLGSTEATDGRYGQFGPRCRRVQPGTSVWIHVEEDNDLEGRKTSLCEVFSPSRGPIGKIVIDYMMRSDGGDCIAEGRAPAA